MNIDPENPELEVDLPNVEKVEDPIIVEDKKSDDITDGIDELKRQLEAERAEKTAAEACARDAIARSNEAEERAHRATTAARDSDMNLVTGAIDQVKANMDLLEERFEQAAAAGDHRAMAKIQREFAKGEAQLLSLEQGKQEMERAPKEEPRRQAADPVEAMASQMEQTGSHRSARWIREHPEFARDQNMTRKMLAAHNLAVADGMSPDTDAYFEAVETTLKLRGAPVVEVDTNTQPQQRQSAPPAAPSSRAAATNGNPNQPNRVRLTADEVEMAEMMGMTPQEYAKNKVALKSEGRIH